METNRDERLDFRSVGDLRAELKRLAASYTPEWAFSEENPDVGSVVALIFANQMSENIRKMNLVLDKYHTEFVNMLNLSLRPAYPASGVAVLELLEGGVPGVYVPGGTRLIGQGNGEEDRQILFETTSDLYVTSSRLRDVIAASGFFGKLIPYLGGRGPRLLPGEDAPHEPEEPTAEPELPPVPLFDFSREGVQRWALLLSDDTMFRSLPGSELFVRLRGPQGEDLAPFFADPARFSWRYRSEEGFLPFDSVSARDGSLVLVRGSHTAPQDCEEICVEAVEPVTETVTLQELALSASCGDIPPEVVIGGESELNPAVFLPFGETASLFDECYIGGDAVFSQAGARVELSFRLESQEHLVPLSQAKVEEDLKIIKRKPKTIQYQAARTSPQKVAVEYFNGIGWRKLPCDEDWDTLFDGTHGGQVSIRFLCPADWRPSVQGGYEGRSLRLRILRADDCYLQPCVHTMPRLSGLTLSYSYLDGWKQPQGVRRLCGTTFADLTPRVQAGQPVEAFAVLPYAGNALYLGFDRPMEGGPVSILFEVEENPNLEELPLRFEYSTREGFETLRVVDRTHGLSETGTVLFLPPSQFARREVEGKNRWWLRIVEDRGPLEGGSRTFPLLKRILPNAVEIRNRVTMPEEVFYITASVPYMRFALSARNILSADVFVNETDHLSTPAMRAMLEEHPEDVRAETDYLGEITEFYVRWHEVDNFDHSGPEDRHYTLDRMNSVLCFGDGVNVRIPAARRGPAFTVQAVCCDGSAANLPAGAIQEPFSQLLFISSVTNPIATSSGSDLESVESARERGANLICSKNRLVSELDFVREVRAFAASVRKVRCLAGCDFEGRPRRGAVSIAVMLADYAANNHAFLNLRDRLRAHLLKRCEATLEDLFLGEPIYVEISVSVWAETANPARAFEEQERLRRRIAEYLDPMTGGSGSGWPIGVLPEDAQLSRMLHSAGGGAVVQRYSATVRYTDRSGVHERSLSDMVPGPFMIGVSGAHTVYMKTTS